MLITVIISPSFILSSFFVRYFDKCVDILFILSYVRRYLIITMFHLLIFTIMEKNMSLAKMSTLCFDAVFRLLDQNGLNQTSSTAVIKSECSYPAIVAELQRRSSKFPVRAQNPKLLASNTGLLPLYDSKSPAVQVYSERVWGLRINQNLMFDTEKYSLQDLMIMALNVPMAKLYSDYVCPLCYINNIMLHQYHLVIY